MHSLHKVCYDTDIELLLLRIKKKKKEKIDHSVEL